MTAPTAQTEERLLEAVIRVQSMSTDINEIKVSMREMAQAINKLALFEERQMNDRQAIGNVVEAVRRHDGRINTLELAQPLQKQATDWVQKAVWLVLVAVISALLTFVVLGRSPDIVSRTTTTTEKQ